MPHLAKGINLDSPTASSPREYVETEIAIVFDTIRLCALGEGQADTTLKMRLESIRDHAQKAIDMLNRIEGAQQPEIYIA